MNKETEEKANTDWLDETGNLPLVDSGNWLDEDDSGTAGSGLQDQKVENAGGQDPLDDWDVDENGKPVHPAETEVENNTPEGEAKTESSAVVSEGKEEDSPNAAEEKAEGNVNLPEEKAENDTNSPEEKAEDNANLPEKKAEDSAGVSETKSEDDSGTAKEDAGRTGGREKLLRVGACLLAVAAAAAVFAGVSWWNGLRRIEAQRLAIRSVGASLQDVNLDASDAIRDISDVRLQKEKEDRQKQEEEEQKAQREKEEKEKLEKEEGTVPIELSLSTIQSDLKVKIRNADTKSLIGDVPFRIKVTTPSGKTKEYEDDDEDGIIYKTGLSSGTYQVALEPLIDQKKIERESEEKGTDYHDNKDYILYSKFEVPADAESISITDKITYEVVDVKDEIKSASEVNTAQEDTAHNDTAVEGTLQDTVAFVDSSKTQIADSAAGVQSAAAASAATGQSSTAAQSTVPEGTANSGAAQIAAAADPAVQTGQNAAAGAAGTGTDAAAAGPTAAENPTAGAENQADAAEPAGTEDTGEAQAASFRYTGWQTIDGKTYYYDANGVYVTGTQVIEGITYTFGDDGVLNTAASRTGIDVSQWNGTIDWSSVASSGISFAIVRCGYRGSSQGMLVADPMVGTNVMGAKNAGLKVGLYFYSQAVNESEAVEEASMAVQMANTYGISMPIYLDVETSGGRGDTISVAQRTANIAAFCQTVANAGYSAGVYANTNWLTEKINAPAVAGYSIWLAQYAAAPTYSATAFHMWQYTSTGHVNGISGNVDLNILY